MRDDDESKAWAIVFDLFVKTVVGNVKHECVLELSKSGCRNIASGCVCQN